MIAALQSHIEKEKTFHRIGNNTLEYERISVDEWDTKMKEIALNGVANASDNAEQITKNISSAATPVYEDEIPPFDITISFANEYGQKASIVIYAVEILNESSGFSIDNVISEKACTFVARKVEYMRPVDRKGASAAYSNGTTTARYGQE